MRRLLLLACLLGGLIAPAQSLAASDSLPADAASQTAVAAQRTATAGATTPALTHATASTSPVGAFYIRGGGYGHGIGMSQYGAYGYALHGWSYGAILAHYYTGTALSHVSPTQTVRVLIKTGSASFSGATGAVTAGSSTGAKKLNPSLIYAVKLLTGGSLAVVDPSGKTVGQFSAPLVASASGPLTVPGVASYRGALEFRADGSGGVQTVDAVALDDYLRGVIGAEMPASWAAQALQAQAVAARTYALTTTVSGNGYTLYRDTRSQMYGGLGAESASTNAAVAATSGQVVTYRGAAVPTLFFASSGGYTEDIENVWPGASPDPWLRGVPDPYDSAGGDPYHSRVYSWTVPSAQSRLGSLVKGTLIGIRITRHGASPRILAAQIVGTGGTTTVSGTQLQSAFGLPTTYDAFASLTTFAGLPATTAATTMAHAHWLPAKLASEAVNAVIPTLRAAALATGIHGVVFPGGAGQGIDVQQLGSKGWQTVAHGTLAANGSYAVRLGSAGQYRIVYHGLTGPTVTVA